MTEKALAKHHRGKLEKALEEYRWGASIRKAAQEAQVPFTTLWRAVQNRYGSLQQEREERLAEAKAEAHAIRREAGRITLEGLQSGEISAQQAPVVWGIASDKFARLEQIPSGERNTLAELLERMGEGDEVVVRKAKPEERAIDVTPEENP